MSSDLGLKMLASLCSWIWNGLLHSLGYFSHVHRCSSSIKSPSHSVITFYSTQELHSYCRSAGPCRAHLHSSQLPLASSSQRQANSSSSSQLPSNQTYQVPPSRTSPSLLPRLSRPLHAPSQSAKALNWLVLDHGPSWE